MADVRGRTFSNGEPVQVDETNFIECTFESAQFRYGGGQLPTFQDCTFVSTSWYFHDSALRTVQLLQVFANQEGVGREFVEKLFSPGNYISE